MQFSGEARCTGNRSTDTSPPLWSAESQPPSFTHWWINGAFCRLVCVCMCVCAGGTAVHGAGQQLRKRGAYVETAVATPLPHMTQLPVKKTHWAFPYCPPLSFSFHWSPASVNISDGPFSSSTSLFRYLKILCTTNRIPLMGPPWFPYYFPAFVLWICCRK